MKHKKSSKFWKLKERKGNGKRKIDWIFWFTLIQTIIAILTTFLNKAVKLDRLT